MSRVRLVAFIAVVLGWLAPRPALAWYFPEHATVTTEALREIAPLVLKPLEKVIEEAREARLLICARGDIALDQIGFARSVVTKRLKSDLQVNCVPFSALPALAADHADNRDELRSILTAPSSGVLDPSKMPLGIEIVTAAALEWKRFQEELVRDPLHVDRAGFVHALDVFLYFLDDDYVRRARSSHSHFHDAGRPLDELAIAVADGKSKDNVLARFLEHHLRALKLARGDRKSRIDALLEHAFALHFLEDAFVSGHLVMREDEWKLGQDTVRMRHDFFGPKGVRVRRALGTYSCDRAEIPVGLAPCWLTYGDGYLGLTADSSDRTHVREAVWLATLEFAMALDPDYVLAQAEKMPEGPFVALGTRLDPAPWWTRSTSQPHAPAIDVGRARSLFRGAALAASRVGGLREAAFSRALVTSALHPLSVPDAEVDPEKGKGPVEVLVGRDLLAPLLALWPEAADNVAELHGSLGQENGFALQLFGQVSSRAYGSAFAPFDVIAPEVGASMGLAYRLGNYVPGRASRPAFEVNAGILIGMHVDTGGDPVRMLPLFQQELRWPVFWELATTYRQPISARSVQNAGYLIFLSGIRMHELVAQPRFVILGFDLEVCAWALSRGNGTYPTYASSPELRFHLGLADPSPLAPAQHRAWGPYLSVTLTGGFSSFL